MATGITPAIGGRNAIPARDELGSLGEGVLSEPFSRLLIGAQVQPATQQIYAVRIGLRQGDTVTNILNVVTTLGVGTAPTLIKGALLSKTGLVLGQSANLAADSRWTTTLGPKLLPLAAAVSITADDVYYAAFLINGAHVSTPMQLGRLAGQSANQVVALGSGVNAFGAQATQTDFAASGSPQTLTVIGSSYPWLAVN